ncbi:hypothetical protein FA13DRAFT_1406933 [Coprinellus micaceus]|uniref:F-box domain-containing protein n=1 Tax=Coprinellus micaceus TaxID=71717 RepID=A0A4Y7SP19_COPMI|nr:hypothetical protein FA13DRAFT_1406933 [Coprinellus micaceus]
MRATQHPMFLLSTFTSLSSMATHRVLSTSPPVGSPTPKPTVGQVDSVDDAQSPGGQNRIPKRKGRRDEILFQQSKRQKNATVEWAQEQPRDLSSLPCMPSDVIHKVLGHLSVVDLIGLSQVSPSFRRTLITEVDDLWRRALNQAGVPEPPGSMTCQRWASLLLVPECESCRVMKVPKEDVDWLIRKRVCRCCKLANLVGPGDPWFKTDFDCDEEMLEYIPHTNCRPFSREKTKLYWNGDIHEISPKWEALSKGANTPGGRREFEKWKKGRIEYVKSCSETVATAEERANSWNGVQDHTARAINLTPVKANSKRERTAGKSVDHTLSAAKETFARAVLLVLMQTPQKLILELEPYFDRRPRPMAVELKGSRKNTRGPILSYVSNTTLFSFCTISICPLVDPPKDGAVLPSDFCPVSPNLKWTKRSRGRSLTAHALLLKFPSLVVSYISERVQAAAHSTTVEDLTCGHGLTAEEVDTALNLAKNVFKCESSDSERVVHIMCGRSSITNHQCLPRRKNTELHPRHPESDARCNVVLHQAASEVSSMLVGLAGLDPTAATMAEMDELDPRFAIVRTEIPGWWTTHYFVFTWREALTFFGNYQKLLAPSSFRLATSEELAASKEHRSITLGTAKAWSCNYCQDFFMQETAETACAVRAHLKERHGMVAPRIHEDYVVHPSCWSRLEDPCPIPLKTETSQYKCLLCHSERRWDLPGMRYHAVSE